MVVAAKIREFRSLTGVGMMESKQVLNKFDDDFDKAIIFLRENGDEPHIEGLSEARVDCLDKNTGEVIKTIIGTVDDITPKDRLNYEIRVVDRLGRYYGRHYIYK